MYVDALSKCWNCGKTGHWWRDCSECNLQESFTFFSVYFSPFFCVSLSFFWCVSLFFVCVFPSPFFSPFRC